MWDYDKALTTFYTLKQNNALPVEAFKTSLL